jgi:hypothetical protein
MIKRFKHYHSKVYVPGPRHGQTLDKGEIDLLNLTNNVQSSFTSDLIQTGPAYLQI